MAARGKVCTVVAHLLIAGALLGPLGAQERHPAAMHHDTNLVVSTSWLAARLDSGLVIIHVGRTDSAYQVAHVPGALFFPLSAVATTVAGIPNELPALPDLTISLVRVGIGDSTRVVIYGDDPLFAARAWLALDLVDHGRRATLLDGGLVRWRSEQRPIETGPSPRRRGRPPLTTRWVPDRRVDAAWVRAHLGDSTVLFVDARPPDQFAGAEPPCPAGQAACATIAEGRRGHIPGARNLYWLNALVSHDDPVLKPMHALRHDLWMALGADAPAVRTIVVYCRTGMQASHAYFVARYLGYPDVRLYDGSMIEWAALPAEEYPVEAVRGGGETRR